MVIFVQECPRFCGVAGEFRRHQPLGAASGWRGSRRYRFEGNGIGVVVLMWDLRDNARVTHEQRPTWDAFARAMGEEFLRARTAMGASQERVEPA